MVAWHWLPVFLCVLWYSLCALCVNCICIPLWFPLLFHPAFRGKGTEGARLFNPSLTKQFITKF